MPLYTYKHTNVSSLCFRMFCLYVRDFLGCKHEFVYRCARTEFKNTGKSSLFNVNSLHSHVRKVSIIWAEQCMKACNIFLRWLLIKLLLFMAFKISFICFIFPRIMPNPHIDLKLTSQKLEIDIDAICIFEMLYVYTNST